MFTVRKVVDDLYYVGGSDRRLELFENLFPIPRGIAYNSYLLLDEKTVLLDAVDWSIARQYIDNVVRVLDGRPLDYLVIHHMEPDHCGTIDEMILRYPNLKIISSEQGFQIMRQIGYHVKEENCIVVEEGDTISFGRHELFFIEAPMVHWPEVIMSLDTTNGVLFSADAFGSFGALDGQIFADEVDFERDWLDDARRYLTNIVGKYGPFITNVLKKAATVDIKVICPLHGPVWRKDLGWFINKYATWASYTPEVEGVLICYGSMYGNTEFAAQSLATALCEKGMTNVKCYDVSKTHYSYLISEAFKYSHIVLASPTYNLGIYPNMKNFIMDMAALNLQNRTVGIIENGSWACTVGDKLEEFLDDNCKLMDVLPERITLNTSLNAVQLNDIDTMANAILESMKNLRELHAKLEQGKGEK